MACPVQGLCQDPASLPVRERSPDVQVYESFFSQVAESKSGDTFYPPFASPTLVLTEYENQALRILAIDCRSELRQLKATISSLRLEIYFNPFSPARHQKRRGKQFEDLQVQHPKIVLEYFELLKVIFRAHAFRWCKNSFALGNPKTVHRLARPNHVLSLPEQSVPTRNRRLPLGTWGIRVKA